MGNSEQNPKEHAAPLDVEPGGSEAPTPEDWKSEIVVHFVTGFVAASLFATTSFYVPSLVHPLCIEGGEYAGNPVAFYVRCNGPLIPGDGVSKDDPQFQALLFAVDAVFWSLTAFAAMSVLRLGVRNLRK